jgi:hypothetical protein
MTRQEKREQVDKALREIMVPFLREKGFKGSMPHFRRFQSDRINLLTFQHSLYDTKFVVEIANCPLEGITTSWDKVIEPSKCTTHHMGYRFRIGSLTHNTDYWFDYGKVTLFGDTYEKVVKEIIELWFEAENWWNSDPYNERITVK